MAESKAVLAASAAINRGHSFAEELRRHLQAVQAAKQQDLAKHRRARTRHAAATWPKFARLTGYFDAGY